MITKNVATVIVFLFCYLINAQSLEKLKSKLEKEPNVKEKISLHYKIAEVFSKANRFDSAQHYSHFAYKLSLQTGNKKLIEESRLKSGIYLYQKGNYEEAINFLESSLAFYSKNLNDSLLIETKKFLGLSYIQKEDFQTALVFLLEIEKLIPDQDKVPVLSAIATIYSRLGDNETALIYLDKTYIISKRYNHLIGLQETYNSLAIIYETENNYEKALEYYSENLSLCKSINDEFCIIMTHNNLAGLYVAQGKPLLALNEIENILPLLNKVNNEYLTITVNINYANYLQDVGLIKKAEKILQSLEDRVNTLNAPEISVEELHIRAKIATLKNNYSNAIILIDDALKWINKYPNAEKKAKLLLEKSAILEQSNRSEDALNIYKQYNKLQDSLNAIERFKTSEILKQKFEVKRYQDKALAQKQETELLKARQKNNTYKILLLISAVIFLIIILIKQKQKANSHRKNYQLEKELQKSKEDQLNQQVNFKNKQITDYALHIREKNDLLKHLSTQIKRIRVKSDNKSITLLANDIILFINNQLQLNDEKISFNKDIKQTEASFLYKIRTQFPMLSERELQIVTYIRLQMSSKQISNKLNINLQSVNNHRLRIRKKLGLSKNEKLHEYLEKL